MSILANIDKNRFWILLVILLVVIAVYYPGLFGGYTFDDFPNIVDNTELHVSTLSWGNWWAAIFSSPSSELQRPLAMLSFAINYFFTGLNPFPIKLTNLVIHLLNVVLAYWLALSIFRIWAMRKSTDTSARPAAAALAVAALWGLAPINLTPVLLVVQRMESLAQIFVFLGLSLYILGRKRQLEARGGWLLIIGGVVACTGVGVMAKETAIAIPLYAFFVEWLLFNFSMPERQPKRRLTLFYIVVLVLPILLAGVPLLRWTLSPQSYAGRPFTLFERLLTESRILWDYVYWSVVPNLNSLSLYHDDYVISRSWDQPISTIFAVLGIFAALIFAYAVRKQRPLTALGIFLFFSAHALTGTVIPLELVYEHRNYFASFALMLIIVDGLILTPPVKRFALARCLAVLALVAFFSFTTCLRASEWGNSVRFALSEAAKHPLSPRATYDEGRIYVVLCNYDANSRFFALAKNALVSASNIPNANILPEQALLILAARTNTPQDPAWWQSMQHKLEVRPIGVQETAALHALSKCQEEGHCDFDQRKMLDTFFAAMHSDVRGFEVLTIFGDYALNVMHDYDLALRLMHGAIEQSPKNMQYHENLARVLIFLGRFNEAQAEIERMKDLNHLGTSGARITTIEQRLENGRKTPTQQP